MNLHLAPAGEERFQNSNNGAPSRNTAAAGTFELIAKPFTLRAEDRTMLTDRAETEDNLATDYMRQDVA